MGMFKRIAKEQRRFVSSIQRNEEFSVALDLALMNHVTLRDLPPEELLEKENMEKLVQALKHTAKYRDETTKLNLHGECAVFSLHHLQLLRLLSDAKYEVGEQPPVNIDANGCQQISALNTDVRYLSWGVKVGVIKPEDFWFAADFLEEYREYVKERIREMYPDGLISIPRPGNEVEKVTLETYFDKLKDPFTYWVPPRP